MMLKYCHQHHPYLLVVEHVSDDVKVLSPALYSLSSMFQMMLKYCHQHHLYLVVVEHVS